MSTTSTTPPTSPSMVSGAASPERGSARDNGQMITRGSLAVLLAGTALLYLWNLSASGNANDFYAAAVQAGTKSWKAFFYGSLDAASFITVDKPPLALWCRPCPPGCSGSAPGACCCRRRCGCTGARRRTA